MGFAVVDMNGRVIDLNPAVHPGLRVPPDEATGMPINQVLIGWHDLLERYRDVYVARDEISLVADGHTLHFERKSRRSPTGAIIRPGAW